MGILEIIIIFVIVFFVLALQIVRMGADADFQKALAKCKKCKNYTGKFVKYRLIYCNGNVIKPEESLECNDFQLKHKE